MALYFAKRNIKKSNRFDEGGDKIGYGEKAQALNKNLGTLLSAVDTVGNEINSNEDSIYTNIYGNTNADPIARFVSDVAGNNNSTDYVDSFRTKALNSFNFSGSDSNDLLKQYNNSLNIGSLNTIGKRNFANMAADNLIASAKGAAAGSAFGPWGCVCKGTRVITSYGKFVNIEDLQKEEGIVGWDGTKAVSESIYAFQPPAKKECVEITFNNGTVLRCSIDHPILYHKPGRCNRKTINGIRYRIPEYSFISASELKENDVVGAINQIPIWGDKTVKEARLLGMLVGDGIYGKDRGVRLFSAGEDTWDCIESNSYGPKLLRKYGMYEQSKKSKRLPVNIHEFNKESIAELLAGLFDTDGRVTCLKNKKESIISLSQSNIELLKEIREQLLKFGIHSYLKEENEKSSTVNGKKVISGKKYILIIKNKESVKNFYENITLNVKYKQDKLDKLYGLKNTLQPRKIPYFGAYPVKVKSVIPIGMQDIYNLQADDEHTYIADGIITHNTLIGGIAGGVLNIGSQLFGRKRRIDTNNAIAQANEDIKRARTSSFNNAVSNFAKNNMFDLESSYLGANGGMLNRINSNDMDNIFAFGGNVFTQGNTFPIMSHIDTGGTHEESPLGGVPAGVDSEGNPNLVEEGETIYNDYVFSNRLSVPEVKVKKGDKITREQRVLKRYRGMTYAEASKKAERLSGISENPNDDIARRTFEAELEILAQSQERQREEQQRQKMIEQLSKLSPEELQALEQQLAQNIAQQQAAEQQMAEQQAMQEQAAMQQQQGQQVPMQGMEMSPEQEQAMQEQAMQEQLMAQEAGQRQFAEGGMLSDDELAQQQAMAEAQMQEQLAGQQTQQEMPEEAIEQPSNQFSSSDAEDMSTSELNAVIDQILAYARQNGDRELARNARKAKKASREDKEDFVDDALDDIRARESESQAVQQKQELQAQQEQVQAQEAQMQEQAMQSAMQQMQSSENEANMFDDGGFKERLLKDLGFNDEKELKKWLLTMYNPQDLNGYLSDPTTNDYDYEAIAKDLYEVSPNKLKNLNNKILNHALEEGYDFGIYDDVNSKPTFDFTNGGWGKEGYSDWKNSTDPAWLEAVENELINENSTSDEIARALKQTKAYEQGTKWLKESKDNRLAYLQAILDSPDAPEQAKEYAKKFVNEEGWLGDVSMDYESIFGSVRDTHPGTFWKTPRNIGKKVTNYIIRNNGTIEPLENTEGYTGPEHTYSWRGPDGNNILNYYKERPAQEQEGNNQETKGNVNSPSPEPTRKYAWMDEKGDLHYADDDTSGINDFDYGAFNRNGERYLKAQNWSISPNTIKDSDGNDVYIISKNDNNITYPKAKSWPYIAGLGLNGLGLAFNTLKKPDYSYADKIIDAYTNAGKDIITPRFIRNYLPYLPIDREYEYNKLLALNRAGNSAITNLSNANAAAKRASIIANDNNLLAGLADVDNKAYETNWNRRKDVIQHRSNEDQFNTNLAFNADSFNAQRGMNSLAGLTEAYKMKQGIDDARAAAINANLQGLADNMFNLYANDYTNKQTEFALKTNGRGNIGYNANGGKLKRRKKGLL